MRIPCEDIVIRDFRRSDAGALFRMVREPAIVRFMGDWAANNAAPEDFYGFIDWLQSRKDSTDVLENKRYAIALKDTDEPVGMVGMGLEDTLNEVEIAYFISAAYRRRGFAAQAVRALSKWCFDVSDIRYLIATIDCRNAPSCAVAEKCGFELFEKRTPIGHRQPNMESDSYFYYRLYHP